MDDQACNDGPVGRAIDPQQENFHYNQRVQEETTAATPPRTEPQSFAKRRAAAQRAHIMKTPSLSHSHYFNIYARYN